MKKEGPHRTAGGRGEKEGGREREEKERKGGDGEMTEKLKTWTTLSEHPI